MKYSLAAAFLLLAACDPAVPPAPRLETSQTNASGDRKGLSECLSDCSAQEQSATDKATCRNNCQVAFKVTPTAGEPLLDAAVACMDRCHAAPAGEVAACVDACKQPAQPAEAQFPGVLERLAPCVDACHADNPRSPDDRATCLRNCSQTAKHP